MKTQQAIQKAAPSAIRYLQAVRFFNGLRDIQAGEVVRIIVSLGKGAAWVERDNGDVWAEIGIDGVRAEYVQPAQDEAPQPATAMFATSNVSVVITVWEDDLGWNYSFRLNGTDYADQDYTTKERALEAARDNVRFHSSH